VTGVCTSTFCVCLPPSYKGCLSRAPAQEPQITARPSGMMLVPGVPRNVCTRMQAASTRCLKTRKQQAPTVQSSYTLRCVMEASEGVAPAGLKSHLSPAPEQPQVRAAKPDRAPSIPATLTTALRAANPTALAQQGKHAPPPAPPSRVPAQDGCPSRGRGRCRGALSARPALSASCPC
jgi:hypothetical protein